MIVDLTSGTNIGYGQDCGGGSTPNQMIGACTNGEANPSGCASGPLVGGQAVCIGGNGAAQQF